MAGRGALIVPLSVYVKRDSPVHRLPALPKLGLVVGFILVATVFARTIGRVWQSSREFTPQPPRHEARHYSPHIAEDFRSVILMPWEAPVPP